MGANGVIYARYSSHKQSEMSIEGQLKDCYAFAEREGLTVVGEYIDRALTGKYDDRPDFQRMIKDAAKKQFAFVIVWKLDRFARNRYDSAIYKHKLKAHGVRVLSACEAIGDNPESIILEAVLEASAEYYSMDLAKKVNRGMRDAALAGGFVGGQIPFGYRVEKSKLVLDEKNADHVRRIFEEYADGVRKRDILDRLTKLGVRASNGQPLRPSFFGTLLRNRKYIGVYVFNGHEVPGGCPRIVSDELFQRVQDRIALTRRAPAAGRNDTADYLLIGKAYCGPCGARLGVEHGRGKMGTVYYYYACSAKKDRRNGCQKKNEKKDFLEWYVCEQTVEYVLQPDRIEIIADAVVAEYEKEFNSSAITDLEKKAARLEAEIESCISRIVDPATPRAVGDRLSQRVEELDLQKTDVEIDLTKLRIACKIRYTREEIVAWIRQFCRGDLMDVEFRRRLIDVLVTSVYVYDDKIVIYYNIKGSRQVSYMEMLDSTDDPEASGDEDTEKSRTDEGSRLSVVGDPSRSNLEHYYIYVNGLFGLVSVRSIAGTL